MLEPRSSVYAEALWDHVTLDPVELGFRAGDVIEVKDMLDKNWWWGRLEEKEGWFPSAFVAVSHSSIKLLTFIMRPSYRPHYASCLSVCLSFCPVRARKS